MNLLVLSPHRDDAAFSLALSIKHWLAAGHRVTVLGVFTRSLSAPFSDADTVHPNDLLNYVSAMRRREDAEFLKLMPGLRMVDLNLKDAPLRLRCEEEKLYTLAPDPEDTAIAKIQKILGKLDAEQTLDAVIIPLALGHHVDHLVVRNAGLTFASSRACAFYEDLPDAIRTANGFEAATDIDPQVQNELVSIASLGVSMVELSPAIIHSDEDNPEATKLRVVSVYASQIDEPTMQAISRFALRYQAGERLWANPAWLANPAMGN